MNDHPFTPLNDDQTVAFAQKLYDFRQTLEPQEQAALDVMVQMVTHARPAPAPGADVQGYDDGGANRLPGDDFIPGYDQRFPAPTGTDIVYSGPYVGYGYYGYYTAAPVFVTPSIVGGFYRFP